MKTVFGLFRFKALILSLILSNVFLVLAAYMEWHVLKESVIYEKENKLLAITRVMDLLLGDAGYEGILREHGVENASRDVQIATLNSVLTRHTDTLSGSRDKVGIGYYSKKLDAVITYGPSKKFGKYVGQSISPEHPGRTVMRDAITNTAFSEHSSLMRNNIMNTMIPLERKGEVIGYVWANIPAVDVSTQITTLYKGAFFVLIVAIFLPVIVFFVLSQRTMQNVTKIITGIYAIQQDKSQRVPSVTGEVAEIATHINEMAEDVEKAQQQSQQAINVLQTVMNNIDVGIYVCDPTQKNIVYANAYLHKIIGEENLNGSPCKQLFTKESSTCRSYQNNFCVNTDGKSHFEPCYKKENISLRVANSLKKNNEFIFMDRLVTWYDGRLLHLVVATNISARKALLEAEAVNKAQRDFLARMSHEIRTPMNGVLGMTHLAIQENTDPKQCEYLRKIQVSASILLGVINDILDFSRIEAGRLSIEIRPFDIYEIVENVRDLILPHTQKNNSTLHISLDASVPQYMEGDSLRISQVLLNLLGNAAKFTQMGSVSLYIKATPLPTARIRLEGKVIDTGIGIPLEQQKHLFEPFAQANKTTSRTFGGTGLGLSIAKALILLMHGEINLTSEEGKGTTFSFFVELGTASSEPEVLQKKVLPWENTRYDGKKFLLVEDNLINQEIALAILHEFGFIVDVAHNGAEAIDAFLAKDYDLIFMDIDMPIMDGLEATRAIRNHTKHDAQSVPIIAMTAHAMHEHRMESFKAGMNNHLSKPIDIDAMKQLFYTCFVKDIPHTNT